MKPMCKCQKQTLKKVIGIMQIVILKHLPKEASKVGVDVAVEVKVWTKFLEIIGIKFGKSLKVIFYVTIK
jgi:hypothetical protein